MKHQNNKSKRRTTTKQKKANLSLNKSILRQLDLGLLVQCLGFYRIRNNDKLRHSLHLVTKSKKSYDIDGN